jgi:hypothetical protein
MGPEKIRAIKLAEKRSEHMPITPNRRVQLDQAWELRQRFHLTGLNTMLRVSRYPARKRKSCWPWRAPAFVEKLKNISRNKYARKAVEVDTAMKERTERINRLMEEL